MICMLAAFGLLSTSPDVVREFQCTQIWVGVQCGISGGNAIIALCVVILNANLYVSSPAVVVIRFLPRRYVPTNARRWSPLKSTDSRKTWCSSCDKTSHNQSCRHRKCCTYTLEIFHLMSSARADVVGVVDSAALIHETQPAITWGHADIAISVR